MSPPLRLRRLLASYQRLKVRQRLFKPRALWRLLIQGPELQRLVLVVFELHRGRALKALQAPGYASDPRVPLRLLRDPLAKVVDARQKMKLEGPKGTLGGARLMRTLASVSCLTLVVAKPVRL